MAKSNQAKRQRQQQKAQQKRAEKRRERDRRPRQHLPKSGTPANDEYLFERSREDLAGFGLARSRRTRAVLAAIIVGLLLLGLVGWIFIT